MTLKASQTAAGPEWEEELAEQQQVPGKHAGLFTWVDERLAVKTNSMNGSQDPALAGVQALETFELMWRRYSGGLTRGPRWL